MNPTRSSEPRATVLVVDDDFGVLESLRDVLSDEGYKVVCACDGAEALNVLQNQPLPDLILLDWMMPRCNGETFRAHQRAETRWAEIPVVLLTAGTNVGDFESGEYDAFLRKPVHLDELLQVVAHCANRAPSPAEMR